jgi:aminopeptidase N
MKQFFVFVFGCLMSLISHAQFPPTSKDTSWKTIYRETAPRINNLVHTKLDVRFDYDKSYMYGKEWLTLKPHFYATDSVTLDAKGMEIKEISMVKGTTKTPLKYTYDNRQLRVTLDRPYKRNENYTLYIDYISKPNELKEMGSLAITDAKGLYFINPKGTEPNKPTQIWTQGETESNSAWMVTIDKPNQKTTQELSMTVPEKYVTLSNGLLKSQKKNADGTRTDYWKMDLPHAPYLFFMGVGDFSIIKDSYKGKEVSYYVEKEYAPYARGIFGNTPEMIKFFSDILGVDYPWPKYAQMVARDYVSGAMENTTATLHQEAAYQNNRELADGNAWEETIAHELFHQWFGDYVTTESWSNITLNESFANYSEYLWDEYKYGKDFADQHHYENMQQYLTSGLEKRDLVRYYYTDKDEVFDQVSYPKGGRILHMLRNYVGDSAFFKTLNYYLVSNKFKAAEAAQLRLAFEEITGKDLHWFWNQWYYGSGHPKLSISYMYDDAAGTARVIVEQTQKSGKIFRLPVAVDVYENGNKKRYNVWIQNKTDTLVFPYSKRPELINVDGDKILLAEKNDDKSEENMIAQWKYGKTYLDRLEAINFFAKKSMPEIAKGLNDKFWGIKLLTIQKLGSTPYKNDPVVLGDIEALARKAINKKVKAAAINYLVKNGDKKYAEIYQANITDSSYSVAGASFKGLVSLDPANAYSMAKKYSGDARGKFGEEINNILLEKGTEEDFEFIANRYGNSPMTESIMASTEAFADYLKKINDLSKVKKGIDHIVKFRNMIPSAYRTFTDPMFNNMLEGISKVKGQEIASYIENSMK